MKTHFDFIESFVAGVSRSKIVVMDWSGKGQRGMALEGFLKNKVFRACVYASLFLFFAFAGVFCWVEFAGSNPPLDGSEVRWKFISIGSLRVTATELFGGNLLFFNHSLPYVGSIVSLEGTETTTVETGYDSLGIYFRMFHDTGTKTNADRWTLMVSLWYPIVLFAIFPAVFLIREKVRPFGAAPSRGPR